MKIPAAATTIIMKITASAGMSASSFSIETSPLPLMFQPALETLPGAMEV
jgi:hypothetical protein